MRNRLVGALFAGCALALVWAAVAAAAKPEIDPTYANGQTVFMIGPKLITGAPANLWASAEELYLVSYPPGVAPVPPGQPLTLPSGYQPQCNPCFHPGLPPMFVYHDHVITGAPGHGNDGTAGEFKGPWKVIVLVYNPVVALNPMFTPVKSAAEVDAGEAAGMFLPLFGGPNPFELETGNVLICPIVSSNA
jgi:hypothetical protein